MHHENRKFRLLDRLKEVALGVLQKKRLKYDWAKNARKEQLLPQWNWRVWLILAGRGFGKFFLEDVQKVNHLFKIIFITGYSINALFLL